MDVWGDAGPSGAAYTTVGKWSGPILDAGQIACWWVNDARVSDLQLKRRYDDGIGERTWVWAWPVIRVDQPMPELPEVIELGEDDEIGGQHD